MASPSETVPRRVLVTGRDGFTGRYVAQDLARAGYEVCGLNAHGGRVDLLDAAAVQAAVAGIRPWAVIHLAAIAFIAHGDVDSLYRTNIVGTRHLLAALAELPAAPSIVVLASSANVYGQAAGQTGKLDESGKKVEFTVKEGDRVLISKYGGTEIKVDGESYLILREDDILGILG